MSQTHTKRWKDRVTKSDQVSSIKMKMCVDRTLKNIIIKSMCTIESCRKKNKNHQNYAWRKCTWNGRKTTTKSLKEELYWFSPML